MADSTAIWENTDGGALTVPPLSGAVPAAAEAPITPVLSVTGPTLESKAYTKKITKQITLYE